MTTEVAGLEQLQAQVLDIGLCTLCGACAGMCPYLKPFQGKIVVTDPCPLTLSRCYQFCPRTGADMDLISGTLFGIPYDGKPLGEVRQVIIARSRNPEILKRAQYGGTVSTLVCMALQRETVNTAVLTKLVNGSPTGVIASSREEVLACSGSSYLVSPTLEAFNQWQPRDNETIGVVGTPCQLLALAKMRTSSLAQQSNISKLALTIGLFCTWGLSQSFSKMLAERLPLSKVWKTDIPPPPANVFQVYTTEGCISIPLDQVRPFIQPACTLCLDMTAEMADLSVGAAEGIEGWNTVLIRTKKGQELLEAAVTEGLLETGQLPETNFNHLVESAQLKKRRALQNLIERTGRRDQLVYLRLAPKTTHRILEGQDVRQGGE